MASAARRREDPMHLRTIEPFLPPGTRWIAALLLSIASLGCEPMSVTSPASAVCSEAGVQCQLPEGPLGVCERAPCAPGASPPCFACISQH
jgi:hypothetical protein